MQIDKLIQSLTLFRSITDEPIEVTGSKHFIFVGAPPPTEIAWFVVNSLSSQGWVWNPDYLLWETLL